MVLRGHESNQGNFIQLLLLRQQDNEFLKCWMMSKYKDYTSLSIQNELLQLAANDILRDICIDIRDTGMFSIIVDGTIDITCCELESIVVRYVNNTTLCPEEVFLGLYNMTNGTSAQELSGMILDILARCNLQLSMLRDQTFDGASNMTGKYNGTQARISRQQPLALFVHCLVHCGNLAAQKAMEASTVIRDCSGLTNDLSSFSKQSTKLSAILKAVQLEHEKTLSLIRPLYQLECSVEVLR